MVLRKIISWWVKCTTVHTWHRSAYSQKDRRNRESYRFKDVKNENLGVVLDLQKRKHSVYRYVYRLPYVKFSRWRKQRKKMLEDAKSHKTCRKTAVSLWSITILFISKHHLWMVGHLLANHTAFAVEEVICSDILAQRGGQSHVLGRRLTIGRVDIQWPRKPKVSESNDLKRRQLFS